MKVTLGAFLGFLAFATLCHARSFPLRISQIGGVKGVPPQARGDYAYFVKPQHPARVESQEPAIVVDTINLIAESHEIDGDDYDNDPNWVPSPEDYVVDEEEYYDDDTKSPEHDPDWLPSPEDYVVDEEYYSYDGGDPDWLPSPEDYVVDQESHEDHGATYEDPDDPDFDPEEYYEEYGYGEDDSYEDDDSDETDVDYKHPEDYYDDEATILEEVLLEIAILEAEREDPDATQADLTETYLGILRTYNLALSAAQELLEYVKTGERFFTPEKEEPEQDQTVVEVPVEADPVPVQQIGLVKGKRQVKTAGRYSQQQQSGSQVNQISQFSQQETAPVISVIQHPDQTAVAEGVEPLYPSGGSSDIGEGVEAVAGEAKEEESSFIGWLGDGWDHISNAADNFGDKVGDTFSDLGDKVGDKFEGLGDKISDVASNVVDGAQDAAQSAGEGIVTAYHAVGGKITDLRQRLKGYFSRFSTMVQRGANYCVQHMEYAADQVQEAQILDKLQQKLAEGNQQVDAFFTLLGEKVTLWAHSRGQVDIDEGLIIIDSSNPQEGSHGEHREGGQDTFPNLFQDQDVATQLTQMVDSGILTQEDLEQISQQQSQQSSGRIEVGYPIQQDSSAIQIQSSRRLRRFRAHRHH